jgi:hypothetical protein
MVMIRFGFVDALFGSVDKGSGLVSGATNGAVSMAATTGSMTADEATTGSMIGGST